MKKIFTLCLASALLTTAVPVFAGDLFTAEISTEVSDNILSREVLHTNYNFSTDNSTLTSGTFSTPSNNSNDINVSFTNDSKYTCTVTLYKKGSRRDTKVGSFTVPGNSSDYETFDGAKSTTYYVKITASGGGSLKGSLKVRQLD